jgi:hypothetical protein
MMATTLFLLVLANANPCAVEAWTSSPSFTARTTSTATTTTTTHRFLYKTPNHNNGRRRRRPRIAVFASVGENQIVDKHAPNEEQDKTCHQKSKDCGGGGDDNAALLSSLDPPTTTRNKIHAGVAIPYNELTIGVLKEKIEGETRVSQTPDSVATLIKAGFTVLVESGGTF